MDWYFFRPDIMEDWDCSRNPNLTFESSRLHRTENNYLGYICILFGVAIELLYIPCMAVISKPEHLKLSCYKIMFVLGLFDMFAIACNSLITGYLFIEGAVFCTFPNLIFVSGAIALGLWCGACMTCLILVTNRLIDLWKPHIYDSVFGDRKTWYIMCVPLFYGLYFGWFTQPLLFSAARKAWFFQPFITDDEQSDKYMNWPHTANNLLIVVATCVLYGCLFYVLYSKFKNEFTSISWSQKSIFLQSTLICMANLIAALIYVYMQFFSIAEYFVVIGHVAWQFGHGFPAIVYLLLNRTIRSEVFRWFGSKRKRIDNTVFASSTHAKDAPTTKQTVTLNLNV